ncbi:MAG: type I DNA topoisomerase [Vampirovibrionales bacterium]|nr:type I DNA topoisomerase [Vampirovibrionales bacterium]
MPAPKSKSPRKSPAKTKSAKAAAAGVADREDDAASGSGKSLVIVESPAKAKTLKKILGPNFQIKASVGHIRDLPQKKIGVDVKKDFEPVYEIMPDKADIVADLRSAAARCDTVYLAADPDREGEAIAWHIAALLKDEAKVIRRIEFHEITKNAILEAIQHPRDIDVNRVNAQQARRVLDRLVGYKLSPLLWKKVNKGLSAGRVQSVAVRLICEREAEIEAFIPEEYWTVACQLADAKDDALTFEAELAKVDGKKAALGNQEETDAVVARIKRAALAVSDVRTRESHRKPSPPFITSTLQREAATRYGFSVKKTMQVAQKLYEGIDVGEGPVGLITYMRTDSTRIADEAQAEAKDYILNQYGPSYYPSEPRLYLKKGKGAQDAHEAIRPTAVARKPQAIRDALSDDAYKLYKIIWSRFVASQMESASISTKTLEVDAGGCLLRTSHSHVTFPGYMAAYRGEDDAEGGEESRMPDLKAGDAVSLLNVKPTQHFTEPPPRFNEASLVKTMEELGIGRPSTYAPTIATVQDRGYVLKEDKALKPTPMGKAVNALLVEHFNDIVDVHFTANLETRLDDIADEKQAWKGVVRDFYGPFEATLEKASNEMQRVHVLADGVTCPNCSAPMAIKNSRWGSQFLGCTAYPECKTTLPMTGDKQPAPEDKPSEEPCPTCGALMVIRHGRFGPYLTCKAEGCKTNRPLVVKTGIRCLKCGQGDIVQKKSRYGKVFFGCDQYPKCDYALWNKPTGQTCPQCAAMLVEKNLKKGNFHACSSKECGYSVAIEAPSSAPESEPA